MDWRRFRKLLADKYGVTNAYMFIGYMAENEDMYNQLHDAGYLVVLKRTLEVATSPDDDAPKIVKGNVDVELVLYAMKEMANYKKAIIVSGDGDFESLIEYLAKKKRLAHVMVPNRQYSSLLKPYDKYIVHIDQLRRQLAYRDRRPKRS